MKTVQWMAFLWLATGVLLASAEDQRPNIVIIMADDMGYSDPGCFGGEINTPSLDQLARNGLRFSQFYNSARCCPTRAALLSGCYPHQVGLTRNGRTLSRNAVTIAEVLKAAGYQTGMTGKWHLSQTQGRKGEDQLRWLSHRADFGSFAPHLSYPCNRGFDEHWGVIWGVVNYFDPFSLVHNETPIHEVPDDFYITDFINDKAVALLDAFSETSDPFFLYVAHCAPHWPLHAPKEDIERYRGRYQGGWDQLREDRYDRMVDLGLVDATTTPLPKNSSGRTWAEEHDKDYEADVMAVHAAMVDRMDQGIGRILQKLKRLDALENTVVFFLSDNGASPERGYKPGFDRPGHTRSGQAIDYQARKDLGSETTWPYLGQPWASACNTPWRYWKKESYEGGCRTPMIVHWPKGLKTHPGTITRQVGHVMDLMPTCLELADARYPTSFRQNKTIPYSGKSLLPILRGQIRESHPALFFEHEGGRAVRQGDWKLAALKGSAFELFNMKTDASETRDLAARSPDKVQQLTTMWESWAEKMSLPAHRADAKSKPARPPPAPSSGRKQSRLKQGETLVGDQRPDIKHHEIHVEAIISKPAKSGVIVAQGGWMFGFSLFVRDGKPVFVIRRDKDDYTEIEGGQSLPGTGRTALIADLDKNGLMTLSVDGNEVARKHRVALIPDLPLDGLAVGDDPDSNVGQYTQPEIFPGTIESVTLSVTPVPVAPPRPPRGLETSWTRQAQEEPVWPAYPRPQLTREHWVNLNGWWQYAIRPAGEPYQTTLRTLGPESWDGRIRVPFAIESMLSGVRRFVGETNRLWYRRTFQDPERKLGEHVLLHFGAVDWETTVWVNGKKIGTHKGGYDPFSFDVTDALRTNVENEMIVSVWDPTDTWSQPRGKQVTEPRGIWYTPVSGIWQTVWLETVPSTYITSLRPTTIPGRDMVRIEVQVAGKQRGQRLSFSGTSEGRSWGAQATVGTPAEIEGFSRYWSPQDPHLYPFTVSILDTSGDVLDSVGSYFAMRTIERKKDRHGFERFYLNGQPLFHYGPLDQGWWPDGLYTAPTDDALRFDIEATKGMGFNMIRKHVKIEPARWYYHCDQTGVMVWQDMPSAFAVKDRAEAHVKADSKADWQRPRESAEQFERELAAMIEAFEFFPSIVTWVPLNEGWGQYDTERLTDWLKGRDLTRLVNAVSGWADRGGGDMIDLHQYPGPGMEPVQQHPGRAVVLGEFGGLGWAVPDHLWQENRNWGYRSYESRAVLEEQYRRLLRNLRPMISRGLAAAVYTQTTDVEIEVNGIMTYDREVTKMDPANLRTLHGLLYADAGAAVWQMADAEVMKQPWSYTMDEPEQNWTKPAYDDSEWRRGHAPFASEPTAFFRQETVWGNRPLWLRRSFNVTQLTSGLSMKIYSDTDAQIYLNGTLVQQVENLRTRRHYDDINISEHAGILRHGKNTIAVSLQKQGKGRRGFDLGLYGYKARGLDLTP